MEGVKNKTKLQKVVSNPDEMLPADSINSNQLGKKIGKINQQSTGSIKSHEAFRQSPSQMVEVGK